MATSLAGALAGSAIAQAPDAGALPSEPEGIPAALDAAPTYRIEILDDWMARIKARGHAVLEEKQLKVRIERYGSIAHVWTSQGDLNTVQRIVKMTVFVNSAPDFTESHEVANGASILLCEVFGERGAHARTTVGGAQIPFGSCVEIEMIVEVSYSDSACRV